MRDELIRDITHHLDRMLDGSLKVEHCDDRLKAVVENWEIPMSLKRLLQWSWFNAPLEAGHYIYSVEQIVTIDDQSRFMKNSLMNIGSCANGDMVCIDYSHDKCPVYFTSHDELWEDESINPRDCSVCIFGSLAEFMLRVAEAKYIPTDSYSGSEYRELLDEIGS